MTSNQSTQSFRMAAVSSSSHRFTSLSHGGLTGAVPSSVLAVEQFVAERAGDAQRLVDTLEEASQERHLRRRARSWRPFGLVRCRVSKARTRKVKQRTLPRYTSDEDFDKIPVATRMAAEQKGPGDAPKVRVRKHWRRPALLLRAHAWAAPPVASTMPRYLETHVWHAKRAHMENLWGHRLASKNCALGTRALYRAMSQHCCAHDRSYVQLVELFGPESLLVDVLDQCGLDRKLLLAREVRAGSRRMRCLMKACDAERRLIGPTCFLWSPGAVVQRCQAKDLAKHDELEELPFVVDVRGENMDTGELASRLPDTKTDDVEMISGECVDAAPLRTGMKLWLWFHPAALPEAVASLNWAAEQTRGRNESEFLQVSQQATPCYFELIGPKALEVLGRALPPEACRSSPAATLWQEIVVAARGQRLALPPGSVLTLEVEESRLTSSSTGKMSEQPRSTTRVGKKDWLARWPVEAAMSSRIWVDEPAEDGYVPVMLIFRPGGKMADVGAGVDVLSATGVHRKLWLRSHFAGARAVGVHDRHQLLADSGLPEFPFDFPETQAGERQAQLEGSESLRRWTRRPPKKRVNFGVLGMAAPHLPDWGSLPALFDPSGRPSICRGSQFQLLTQPRFFYSQPGRCHLYRPSKEEAKLVTLPGRATRAQGHLVTVSCPAPVTETPTLEEPLHRNQKLGRLRRQPEAAKVETIRSLIGFVTSGGFSYRHGRGAGVGAVVAQILGEIAHEQTGDWDHASWLWLWARRTTSLQYFPVLVQCLPDDQGYG
ncbi:unnamed protein product [Durusdinium trenchii]|uniref:Uncharacterized protein n=1 Tax=Durusdinium trenchii TaxID=1381693 RepID=A0ABP0MDL2_9DINO